MGLTPEAEQNLSHVFERRKKMSLAMITEEDMPPFHRNSSTVGFALEDFLEKQLEWPQSGPTA